MAPHSAAIRATSDPPALWRGCRGRGYGRLRDRDAAAAAPPRSRPHRPEPGSRARRSRGSCRPRPGCRRVLRFLRRCRARDRRAASYKPWYLSPKARGIIDRSTKGAEPCPVGGILPNGFFYGHLSWHLSLIEIALGHLEEAHLPRKTRPRARGSLKNRVRPQRRHKAATALTSLAE